MNLGLANPQWTPLERDAPEWMRLGFSLFAAAGEHQSLEIFPTACYRMLEQTNGPSIRICLSGFARGPKDMLDAYVAAVTAGEFIAGRGCEIGGGDGLGTIVLPRPCVAKNPGLLAWPCSA
jgi:hypothetical protein